MRHALNAPSRPVHDMQQKLAVEAGHKHQVALLFMPHEVEDISAELAHRKSGTDFFLRPRNSDGSLGAPIRCENKFEQYASGRQTAELVSVDRPTSRRATREFIPGWMYTSQAAWLLSWFPSQEVLAVPLDDLRELVLGKPVRNLATSAKNATYLSWSLLEDVNHVVQSIPNARVLDLRYELGVTCDAPRLFGGASLKKVCSADELVELMRTLPAQSQPREVSDATLRQNILDLAPKDLMKKWNAPMRSGLRFLDEGACA